MKSNDSELRKQIKQAIADNPSLNQKVIAAKVGCSPGYISLLLNNKKKGDSTLLAKIAVAAGIKKITIGGFEIQEEFGFSAEVGAEIIRKDPEEQQSALSEQGLTVIAGEKNGQFDPSTTEYLQIISRFRHKEWAQKMNSLLLVIEKDPVQRETIERIVKAIAQQIKSQDQAVNDHE